MPRVLRIINRLNLGGPTFNASYLSKHLPPEYETLLLSGMHDATEASSDFIARSMGLEPVYIDAMHRSLHPVDDWKSFQKIRQIIRNFKPDIVHTHAAKAGAVGRAAAFWEKVPVVVHTFHGHVFHSYFSPVKTRIFLEIERSLAKKTTRLIAISDLQKRDLSQVFKVAPEKKFEVIPLGFDLSRFREQQELKRATFRKEYLLSEQEIAIAIVGRLVPIKNHKMFFEAIRMVYDRVKIPIRVFIVGDGEERANAEAIARHLNLDFSDFLKEKRKANVTFTSWIREIDFVNAGCDIIALTSLNEGTPVSLIEAQAAGRPIAATDVGGVANAVIPNKTALLSPSGDAVTFAENLMRLIENPGLRKAMSEDGPRFVMEKFHFQRLVKDMEQLYNRLLKEVGVTN